MSQFDDDDEFDFDSGSNAINDVRKALRAAEKRNKALEQELGSFRTESRKRELADSITARGLNPKIAAFIPADVATSALGEWLDQYGDVFAPAGAVTDPAADEQSAVPAPEGADVFSQVANTGSAPTGDEGQLMAQISGAKTKAELDTLIFGAPL